MFVSVGSCASKYNLCVCVTKVDYGARTSCVPVVKADTAIIKGFTIILSLPPV